MFAEEVVCLGRPHKEGVFYWNLDVDFFQNKKIRLIRGEFGVKGVYITILLLNEIYRTGGYFLNWDDDDCLLMSDSSGVAGECGPDLISEVIQGLLKRSFFDRGIYEKFHVLTSAGIQRRFLRMVGNSRESIPMVKEYFLLDTSIRGEVTEATMRKVIFHSIFFKGNDVSLKENPSNLSGNASKSGEKNEGRKDEEQAAAVAPKPFADSPVLQEAFDLWLKYKRERREALKPVGMKMLISRIRKNVETYGADAMAEVIRNSMANNYQGIIYDWLPRYQQSVGWNRDGRQAIRKDSDYEGGEN